MYYPKSFEEEDRIDRNWGDIVKCEAIPMDGYDHWPFTLGTCVPYLTPVCAFCRFVTKFENGFRTTLYARGFSVMEGIGFTVRGVDVGDGWMDVYAYGDKFGKPYNEYVVTNKRLVATTLKALASATPIPFGDVELVGDAEADAILKDANVTDWPHDRPENVGMWGERFLKSGICIIEEEGLPVTKWLHDECQEGLRFGLFKGKGCAII